MVQETFIQAYQGIIHLRPDGDFGHWILRIATNVAHTHYRRGRRAWVHLWNGEAKEHSLQHSGDSLDARYPTLQVVHRALDLLSPTLREAVILFELEGLSLSELATTLQIPLDTAASHVRRGREGLRRHLERMGCGPVMERTVVICGSEPQ